MDSYLYPLFAFIFVLCIIIYLYYIILIPLIQKKDGKNRQMMMINEQKMANPLFFPYQKLYFIYLFKRFLVEIFLSYFTWHDRRHKSCNSKDYFGVQSGKKVLLRQCQKGNQKLIFQGNSDSWKVDANKKERKLK